MARPAYRAHRPRSPPHNNARRSRSPFRGSRPSRRSISRSPSRSNSRSPSNASRRGLNDRLRSRSRSPPRDARAGDKRPRSTNHYQTASHSDPRRFKVHYEKETGNHHDPGHASRGRTGGTDRANTGRLTHQGKDHGRLSRGLDLPTRLDQDRANARSALGSGELVHSSQQDPDSDKASPKAFSKGSSVSESAHNQKNDVAHGSQSTTNGVPYPRYANPSVKFRTISKRDADRHGPRDFQGQFRNANQCHLSVDAKEAANNLEEEITPQLTEDELIEQRRKKREAIKAKYRNQQQPLLKQALEQTTLSAPSTPQHESSGVSSEHVSCEFLPCSH